MLLSFSKQKWLDSLSSKPPLQSASKSANPLTRTIVKKKSQGAIPTPKRQNSLTNSPGVPSSKKSSIHSDPKQRAKTSEKGNQTEISSNEIPGNSTMPPQKAFNPLSHLNPENSNPLSFTHTTQGFRFDKPSSNADRVLREFNKVDYEKINSSLYIENLCNIQEKQQVYEVKMLEKPVGLKPKQDCFVEDRRKIINLYNDPERPFTFPDRLPGNNLRQPEMPKKKIEALVRIQKHIRGFLARRKFQGIKNEKPKFLGQNILLKSLEAYSPAEVDNIELFTKTLPQKPLIITSDFASTIKPLPRDPFEKSDGCSIIGLFLRENPQKVPVFKAPSQPLKPTIPKSMRTEEHRGNRELLTQQASIEEYSETFEDLTPSQSFIRKSQSNLKDSIIRESIEEETHNQSQNSIRKGHSLRESIIKESLEAMEEEPEDIMEESGIKGKFHDNSYNYDDEKFESVSEDRSLKAIRNDSSLEDSAQRKFSGNLKRPSDLGTNLTPKTKSPGLFQESSAKMRKTVNFSAGNQKENDKFEKPVEKSVIKHEKQEKQLEKQEIYQEKHFDKHEYQTERLIDRQTSKHERFHEFFEDSSGSETMTKLMDRAKSEISSFNKHDGELSQLKSQLFGVLDDLKHLPQSSHRTISNPISTGTSDALYSKFQSEFSRLMSLRTANEYLSVHSHVEEQQRLRALVLHETGKEILPQGLDLHLEIDELKKKQQLVFETLLALFQKQGKEQEINMERKVNGMQDGQGEILRMLEEQGRRIEELMRKGIKVEQKEEINIERKEIKDEHPQILTKEKPKQPEKDQISKEKKFNEIVTKATIEQNKPEIATRVISRESEDSKNVKTPVKPLEEAEEIDEYIDDFEVSTPNIPNIQLQKSFELQKSTISNKSPGLAENLTPSLDNLRSLSYISSDKEIDNEADLSGISWHNINTPVKPMMSFAFKEEKSAEIKPVEKKVEKLEKAPEKNAKPANSKEKIIDNLTEFVTEQIISDIIEKERLFPLRNTKELDKIINKLSHKRPESLSPVHKGGLNLENFEEKSPTKMKKRVKSSSDDLFRSSLEMSVRNEEFIDETEKAVRSLESKLKRRNNQEKIKQSVQLISEDLYNNINMFTEQDLKEKGDIIVDAFNEQLKMNIIKEFNENKKKDGYFGEVMDLVAPETIQKNFKKICVNTKKGLLKSAQNQLKENEEYVNLKENVRNWDFNRLVDFLGKEKYPLEEEENIEMLEYEVNKNWTLLKRECVEDAIEECVKDVIMEMNRLGNKRGNPKKK